MKIRVGIEMLLLTLLYCTVDSCLLMEMTTVVFEQALCSVRFGFCHRAIGFQSFLQKLLRCFAVVTGQCSGRDRELIFATLHTA